MNETKKRILEVALALFNSKGVSKVSLRAISDEMGISLGNLTYHFKKREDIVESLYFQLVNEFEESMTKIKASNSVLEMLLTVSKNMMHAIYKHRFFLLDFVQIMREHKKIRTHYHELYNERVLQFEAIFDRLVQNGKMRKEVLPNEYRNLFIRLKILGDFWISFMEIGNETFELSKISVYEEIIIQEIFPYLTDKGRKEYYKIRSK